MRIMMLALLVGGCTHRSGNLRLDERVLPEFLPSEDEEDAALPEEDCSATVTDAAGNEIMIASMVEIEAVPGSTVSKTIRPHTSPEALLEGEVLAKCRPLSLQRLYISLTGGDHERTGWLVSAGKAQVEFKYRSATVGTDNVPQITDQITLMPQPVASVTSPAMWVVNFPEPVMVSEGQRIRFTFSAKFGPQPHGKQGLTPSPSDTLQAHVIMASWTDDAGSVAKDIRLEPPFDGPVHDYIESIGSL